MRPVIIQNLIRSMKNRIQLPAPSTNEVPQKKDRAREIVLACIIFAIFVALLF